MSNVGATTGDEPDYIDDADLASLDELRGYMKDIQAAHLTNIERATVAGAMSQMEAVNEQLAKTQEQMRHLIGLYQTLQGQFDQFNDQRIKELQVRVNGGSTTPEDLDGDLN